VKKFNIKPKDGITFLIQKGYLKENAPEVAKFLKTEETLRKSKIGEYLGERKNFNIDVLKCFVDLFDFSGMPFDGAVRSFLSTFRLPGEAQKIDKIMEQFASRYCSNNPQVFEHPDTAYVLAFALIMLNTDAHNANVIKKMTKDQFISNNRGINNGKDLTRELLENLYDSIVNNEISMEHERDDISQYDQQGWLTIQKSSGPTKKWVKLFCIISNSCLYIFENPKDSSPQIILPLENLAVEGNLIKAGKKDCFVIHNPGGKIRTAKNGKEKWYEEILFCADSWKTKFEWMYTLHLNSSVTPNYKALKKTGSSERLN